jgi:hypothetical protein
MRQRIYGFSLLAAVLATLVLSGPATAGEEKTFLARSSGMVTTESVTFPNPDGPPLISTRLVGEGQSALLGKFKVTSAVVIDVAAGYAKGDWTYTLDNGDQLFASFRSVTQAEEDFLVLPALQSVGFFTFKGGTGRFQGATGSYIQFITFATDPEKGPAAYTDMLAGWISQ